MNKELIAPLVGLAALIVGGVITGMFNLIVKRPEVKLGDRKEDREELDDVKEERDKAKAEALAARERELAALKREDEWRNKYWEEVERNKIVIGNKGEVQRQAHILETHIPQPLEEPPKTYLELGNGETL